MDWRFSLKVELTRKADRFDVRGKEKGGTQVILRCCVYAACAELEETEGRTVGCRWMASSTLGTSQGKCHLVVTYTARLLPKQGNNKNNSKKTLLLGHTSLYRFEVFFYYKELSNFLHLRLKCDRQTFFIYLNNNTVSCRRPFYLRS